ncbi:Protein ccc1 [Teratosphaeriaceae sp. CCFEE 6253]|nr:Protein ccc1 [Teratosphaeriaceae sp. CCFEE 6253]
MASETTSEKTVTMPHKEGHTGHGELVRDTIIGFADGLTVPFALTAALSSLGSAKLVILGGLAELFAGSLSMGLGAYLAAVTEMKHYEVEELRERAEVKEKPKAEEEEIYEIFEQYGIARTQSKGVVEGLKANEDMWIRFMMDFELKLEKPRTKMAWIEGLVMGVSYFLGGLLPMIPYFAFTNVNHALFTSIGITVLVLVVFGYVKALVTGCRQADAAWSAVQTLIVGAVAAGASYGIVRGVNSAEKVTAL